MSYKNFKNLNEHQLQTLIEFSKTNNRFKPIGSKHYFPKYEQIDYMFKVNKNPDYFNNLPMQTNQKIIKKVVESFSSWLELSKKYNIDHSKFKGRPRIPGYVKTDKVSFGITNQDAKVYKVKVDKDNTLYELKLPKTKKRLTLLEKNISDSHTFVDNALYQVEVIPFYDVYKINVTFKTKKEPINLDKSHILALDPGINNFLTSSNNVGLEPFIINGKTMKSVNVYANKKIAEIRSILDKQFNRKTSPKVQRLWMKRNNYFRDMGNKIAYFIMDYCIKNNIGTVVIGKNSNWKNESNIGKISNQKFCFIPHSTIFQKIKEKCESVGITYIEREESHTSKASFLDKDNIPIYEEGSFTKYNFSGKRVERGLYKTKKGILINADVNGASNILRKEFKDAFKDIKDFSYLYKTVRRITIT